MNKIIILGHENPDVDSIVSGYLLEKILNKKGYKVEYIIDAKEIEKETLTLCINYGIDPTKHIKSIDFSNKNNKYILVDHNERIIDGEIICIIDHHPTNKKFELKNYYNEKVSSTACFIAKNNEILLDEFDLRLAILATLVDTASFHSTKSREEDKEWVFYLCNKYNFNYDELYQDGLCLTNLDNILDASINGLKKYNINNKLVESSYIQVNDIDDVIVDKIIDILNKRLLDKGLYAFVFIIHNMKEFKTMYYLIRKDNIFKKYYDKYTSRGNTIIPEIEKNLTN